MIMKIKEIRRNVYRKYSAFSKNELIQINIIMFLLVLMLAVQIIKAAR